MWDSLPARSFAWARSRVFELVGVHRKNTVVGTSLVATYEGKSVAQSEASQASSLIGSISPHVFASQAVLIFVVLYLWCLPANSFSVSSILHLALRASCVFLFVYIITSESARTKLREQKLLHWKPERKTVIFKDRNEAAQKLKVQAKVDFICSIFPHLLQSKHFDSKARMMLRSIEEQRQMDALIRFLSNHLGKFDSEEALKNQGYHRRPYVNQLLKAFYVGYMGCVPRYERNTTLFL
eukprot:GEMP01063913.1.p1 GENE.GEMP01063913.1~~GEMP01063913.1.p1  ORF type:complete len:239 (+),score=30.81 GEMP01063913.1:69-785(+)